MGQYNLGSLNSSGTAIRVVAAGDPETLILNHSTKNTVYIGTTNAVGSGNLLDATPLDPYASIVVNGTADVWAVAAIPTQPATVYTYQNALNWTPQAVQPNIVDAASPYTPGTGTISKTFTIPARAQGINISWGNPSGFTQVTVIGVQSGIQYALFDPQTTVDNQMWVPILSDADQSIQITTTASTAPRIYLVWLMNQFVAGGVETNQVTDVNIANVGTTTGYVPVGPIAGFPIQVVNPSGGILAVSENSKQMFANQEPIAFDSSVASGATITLLPASAGVQYFLHGFRIEFIGTTINASYAQLQDTTPTVFANFNAVQVGTAANQYQPPFGDTDFNGSPIPIGLGVQLKNNGTSTTRFIGTLRYSK